MNNNIVDNLSLVLQVLSLQILFDDFNNTDLMQELQRQDKEYLEKIINQNEKIISLLEERRNNHEREIGKEDRGVN
jgi:hypothetical protein